MTTKRTLAVVGTGLLLVSGVADPAARTLTNSDVFKTEAAAQGRTPDQPRDRCGTGGCDPRTGRPGRPIVVNGGDTTTNIKQRFVDQSDYATAHAPAMALSNGHCQDSDSHSSGIGIGVPGVGALSLSDGRSKSRYNPECGQDATLEAGATNENCGVAAASISKALGVTMREAVAVACAPQQAAPRRQPRKVPARTQVRRLD